MVPFFPSLRLHVESTFHLTFIMSIFPISSYINPLQISFFYNSPTWEGLCPHVVDEENGYIVFHEYI